MSKSSAIIVTWNSEKIIAECLQSAIDQTESFLEIVVVDNNSTDDTVKKIEQEFGDKVTLLQQETNTGFAKGNNIGIKSALQNKDCHNIVLLNADARLDKKWLAKISSELKSHPKIVAAQGLTLNYFDHQKVDAVGIQLNQRGQAIQLGFDEERKGGYKDQDIFGVNAAAALYTRTFLEAQPFDDYFDETLYMYYEDVDLALRAQVMGGRARFVSEAIAYHMGSASKIKVRAERLMVRNAGLILIKNLPSGVLRSLLPSFMKVQLRRVFGHVKNGHYNLFFAGLIGSLQGLLLTPIFVLKRRRLKKLVTIKADELWQRM